MSRLALAGWAHLGIGEGPTGRISPLQHFLLQRIRGSYQLGASPIAEPPFDISASEHAPGSHVLAPRVLADSDENLWGSTKLSPSSQKFGRHASASAFSPSFVSIFMVVEVNLQPLRAWRLLAFSAVGGAILLPLELEWDGGG